MKSVTYERLAEYEKLLSKLAWHYGENEEVDKIIANVVGDGIELLYDVSKLIPQVNVLCPCCTSNIENCDL